MMESIKFSQAASSNMNHLLKAEEVAEYLSVSRSFAYLLIQTGEIPAVRLGRAVRIRPQDLQAYIEKNLNLQGENI